MAKLERRLGTGRYLTPGKQFEIRNGLSKNNYFVVATDDNHVTIPGLYYGSEPLKMDVITISDPKRLTAFNLVIPITVDDLGDDGPAFLLRLFFNEVTASIGRGLKDEIEVKLKDYNLMTNDLAETTPDLYGYPKDLIWQPL